MLGVLNIINKYFWKSWSGPFFTFIIAPLIMIICMSLFTLPTIILANALSIPIICTGAIIVPQTIFEFRNSVILKRIGATNVKPIVFMGAIVLYFTSFMIISLIVNLLVSMLYIYIVYGNEPTFGKVDFYGIYNSPDYLSWSFAQFLTICMSLSIGFLSASVLKSVLAIQTFGLLLIIASMFVGGAMVPFSMVVDIPVLRYLSYITPYKYTSELAIESWFANINNVLNANEYKYMFQQLAAWDPSTDVAIKMQTLLSLQTNHGYLIGEYQENGVFKFLTSEELATHIVKNELDKIPITYIDAGKGFIYKLNANLIINGSDIQRTVNPYTSLFNFKKSNIWDTNIGFMQVAASMGTNLNQAIPSIKELWIGAEKILAFVMPFVFTGLAFGVSTINFKWNSRGA